jgi:hypothetical protein
VTLEQRPKEMHQTEERALTYLRDATTVPSAPPLTGYSLRFRLWYYPAFHAHQSWSIFELHRRGEPALPIVRQVTWDRPHDCQRLRDPLLGLQEGFHTHPKIELRDRPLDRSELAARLAAAKLMSVPIVGRDTGICLDGGMSGYEERDGSPRLEWCCDGPPEWREFTTWATEMMRWLRHTCAV